MEGKSKIVEIKNLSKRYGSILALHDISLSLNSGKIIGLLGPNGAGKTTLIKILTGLIQNYNGEVLIDGHPIGRETKAVVSYLPDAEFIGRSWTVKYAIEFYKDFFADFDENKALELMKILNVPLNQSFKSLSKGTKEKVQLVLTLSRNAKLYIFDEPIAGVDPAARDLIFRLILDNYNKDASIIISTHLIADAEQILDEFIFIQRGVIKMHGDVKKVVEEKGMSIDKLFREEFRCLADF